MSDNALHCIRKDYRATSLEESQVKDNPVEQLKQWLQTALEAKLPEPNALTLATVDTSGQPAARIVLLRDISEEGLTFYTNYLSRKGRELETNPHAAALLFWASLERQVRIEGAVTRLSPAESDAYFQQRPYESRLGAWASPQSETITNRQILDQNMQKLRVKYPTDEVPRPPHWGGYRLVPNSFEFWQGRPSRLNDRLLYMKQEDGKWVLSRLAP